MARTANIVLISCGLLLLAICMYMHFITGAYGDKQWEMLYATMWLGGKHLYTDIFPVSPPLIFWLYAIPAALSAKLHLFDPFKMLSALGLCLTLCSIALATFQMTRHLGFAGSKRRLTEFAAMLIFVVIFRTSPLFFLDREHLFFMLILPYLMRGLPSLARTQGLLWLSVLTGIFAGIGFCIKPHCFVVFAGIQLMHIVFERSFRMLASIENFIIYAIGIGYLFSVWWLAPEYFNTIIPMALATYSKTRDEAPIWFYAGNAVSVLVLTFIMFRPHYTSPYRKDIYYLACLLPFFFFYALANNNWSYTYYPLSSIALVITGFVYWEFIYLWRDHRARGLASWTFLIGACACLVNYAVKLAISVNFFFMVFADGCRDNVLCRGDAQFVAEVTTPDRTLTFGVVSVEFDRWTRLAWYSGAKWETRFPQLWMLPKFLASGPEFEARNRWVLDYVADALATDMNTRKPDVMFVSDANMIYGKYLPVDLVAFFSANPNFRDAWQHYRPQHHIYTCDPPDPETKIVYKASCSYYVYRRID